LIPAGSSLACASFLGASAQFEGNDTVNGGMGPTGNPFKLTIWVTDGPPDTLRFRTWWEVDGVETDVHDNAVEQAIGASDIVVHTSK
jgi:hypothetical protein